MSHKSQRNHSLTLHITRLILPAFLLAAEISQQKNALPRVRRVHATSVHFWRENSPAAGAQTLELLLVHVDPVPLLDHRLRPIALVSKVMVLYILPFNRTPPLYTDDCTPVAITLNELCVCRYSSNNIYDSR